jgi:transcriptional regulator with XRE-family HTH domain
MSRLGKDSQKPIVDPVELARRVRAKRDAEGLSLREAGIALSMSAATLSRVESGKHLPDRDRLFRLADWAGMPLGGEARAIRNREVHRAGAGTVEAVELHLRADKDLDPEDADFLVNLMKTAYDRVSQRK